MSENKVKRSEKLRIQERDVVILKFLDRVGYANVRQVAVASGTNGDEKAQAAVLRRLYLLRRFEYVKAFSTHLGNYYALDRVYEGENAPIRGIKLDQLSHHDFLIELFFIVKNEHVISEREAISQFKIVGKKGKVPDMVINNWIIEFERTNKSVADCKAVVDYWTGEQGRDLCVIFESEQIKNRYQALINPRVKLLARSDYTKILQVLSSGQPASLAATGNERNINNHIDNTRYVESIKNKYL